LPMSPPPSTRRARIRHRATDVPGWSFFRPVSVKPTWCPGLKQTSQSGQCAGPPGEWPMCGVKSRAGIDVIRPTGLQSSHRPRPIGLYSSRLALTPWGVVSFSDMDERPANPDTAPDLPCVFGASPPGLSDVAQLRREQIMDAAEAIIAQEGIHRLSLNRIEKKVGKMSRGQLTYYFPNKESILLAVHGPVVRGISTAGPRGEGREAMDGRG